MIHQDCGSIIGVEDDFMFCDLCQIFCDTAIAETYYRLELCDSSATVSAKCTKTLLNTVCIDVNQNVNQVCAFSINNHEVKQFSYLGNTHH